MSYFAKRRDAYKAARQSIRDAMVCSNLDRVAISDIAEAALKNFKDVSVDLDDLVGACLYYQEQVYPERKQY